MKRFLRWSSAALLCVSCGREDTTLPPRANEPLQTDQRTYVARARRAGHLTEYNFSLVARLTNNTADTIYLNRCGPSDSHPIYWLERLADSDTLDTMYNRAWACVGHDQPFVLFAGEVRVDTLALRGPNLVDGRTGVPHGEPEGPHRVYYEAASCADFLRCELPRRAIGSNIFLIRAPSVDP